MLSNVTDTRLRMHVFHLSRTDIVALQFVFSPLEDSVV